MTDASAFKALSLVAALGVFVVAACTIPLRGGEDPPPQRPEPTADATSSDLARCRSVTFEDTAGYQHCQRVWAENRHRFFGRRQGGGVSGQGNPVTGPADAPKDQSRMPQGYPPVALPDASKP